MTARYAPLDTIEGSVFVVTYGRSGSTLLQNLLNSIDGYCIRGENGNAIQPLARAWQRVSSEKNIGEKLKPTTADMPWYGAELIDRKAYGQALANAFAQQILHPPEGTRVIGFKEIRWASPQGSLKVSLDFLKAFFPKARFVFNTRDHASVARSAWWGKRESHETIAALQGFEQEFASYRAANARRCAEVRYDDYVADHEALRPLFDFLNEPWDDARVQAIMAERLTH